MSSSLTLVTDVRLWTVLFGVAIILLYPIILGWAYFRRRRTFTRTQWISLALATAISVLARLALLMNRRISTCQIALWNMLIVLYCGATLAMALVMFLSSGHISHYVPALVLLWTVMDVLLTHKSGVAEERKLVLEWDQLVDRFAQDNDETIPRWKRSTEPLGIVFWLIHINITANEVNKVKQSCTALTRLQELYNASPIIKKHVEEQQLPFARSLSLYGCDVRGVAELIRSAENPKLPLPGCITTLSFVNCYGPQDQATLQQCVDTLIHKNMTTVQFGVDTDISFHVHSSYSFSPAKFIGAILQSCGRHDYSFTTVDMSAIDDDSGGSYNQNLLDALFEFDWSFVLLHVLQMSKVKTLQLRGSIPQTEESQVKKFVNAFIESSNIYRQEDPTSTKIIDCDLRDNAGLAPWKTLFEETWREQRKFRWAFRFDDTPPR